MPTWTHAGGKLVELGPASLTGEELLAVLIGSGYKGRSAQDISKEVLDNYYSIRGLMEQTPADLAEIKGLKGRKIARIAAAFEITKRILKDKKWVLPKSDHLRLGLPNRSEVDILAVLIGSGYKNKRPEDISKELLNRFGSIAGLMGQDLSSIAEIEGLGDVRVIRIVAALEVACRTARALENE